MAGEEHVRGTVGVSEAFPRSRRLRICVVSHIYLEPRYVGKLYQLAAQADLLLVQPSRLAPHPPASITSTAAFTVATLRPIFPSGIRSSTRWVLPGLVQRIAAFQPDIIQVENELHSFITIQALLARSTVAVQAKVVVAFWQNVPLRGWRRLLGQPLNRRALRQVDFFLPGNLAGQALLLQAGISRAQLQVLPPYGVDPEWFSPWPDPALMRQRLGLPESHFIVGFSGRLVPEKGGDRLGRCAPAATCGRLSCAWADRWPGSTGQKAAR
ncbi:MAG: hypothetical protein KatS3mg061_0805 [Dehalococcoidia bacterium]|nr:MAG: hypothetical protein KatS3mg061_0805 [Dehalococcoidia bacterium]